MDLSSRVQSHASHDLRKTWANVPDLTVQQRRPVFQIHGLLHAPRPLQNDCGTNEHYVWNSDRWGQQSLISTPSSEIDMRVFLSKIGL